uniref:Uncharacterized protein n=1 Tax=Aegilops tauschii subsp. strangulata TaxID=200361 RepID=A0A453QQW3_AEGTS
GQDLHFSPPQQSLSTAVRGRSIGAAADLNRLRRRQPPSNRGQSAPSPCSPFPSRTDFFCFLFLPSLLAAVSDRKERGTTCHPPLH